MTGRVHAESDETRGRPGDAPEELWAARVAAVPEGSGYDAQLGARVARDARSVVAGELSAEEFGRRYHDAYLEEFGRDDRPDSPTTAENSERGGTRLMTRREALATLGGAVAGVLFLGELYRAAGLPGPSLPDQGTATALADTGRAPVQFGMVIDLERCDGCLYCVDACRTENGLSDGVLWPYVFAYQEPDDRDRTRFLVRVCQQCTQAPCVMVCPTAARHRRPSDGLVLTDYDVCIGCRYCEVACPYGVNYFQWGDPATYGGTFAGERRDARGIAVNGDPPRGVIGKCTYCPLRQDDPERRGTTACADACPMNAIHVGDMNDPDSAPNRYLAQRREENSRLPTFRLLEDLGTEPNVIYIGSPPSPRAELVENPVSYRDWGLRVDRRAVLEGPKPWFKRIGGEA